MNRCADRWCDRPAKYEVAEQRWCGIHARMHKKRNERAAERKRYQQVAEADGRRAWALIDRFAGFGISGIAYESTRSGLELILTEVQAQAILQVLEAER